MVFILVVSAPEQFGTSTQRSVEFTSVVDEVWGLAPVQEVDVFRQRYVPSRAVGTVFQGQPWVLDPGISVFQSRVIEGDMFVYARYPDDDVFQASLDILAVLDSYATDKVFIVTVSSADPSAGPNCATKVTTVFPGEAVGEYAADADPFIGPLEYRFVQHCRIPVCYVTLHVTDPYTSSQTIDFYRDSLAAMRTFHSFLGDELIP